MGGPVDGIGSGGAERKARQALRRRLTIAAEDFAGLDPGGAADAELMAEAVGRLDDLGPGRLRACNVVAKRRRHPGDETGRCRRRLVGWDSVVARGVSIARAATFLFPGYQAATAVAILAAKRDTIRSPGGCLRGMTARACDGKLYLLRSLHGLGDQGARHSSGGTIDVPQRSGQ